MTRRMQVVTYLEKCLLTAIRNDLAEVLRFHLQKGGGFHSIARETFCYIDYLGSVRYSPPAQSSKAIQYIENYMARVNKRYSDVGRLIYELWRHGTVHEYDPKVLIHSCRRFQIGWLTNNSPRNKERACHLECFKIQNSKNKYVIAVNLFQLIDDLISSTRALINELQTDYKLCREVQRNFKEVSKPILVDSLPLSKKSKAELNSQIRQAIRAQAREVDNNGRVVQMQSSNFGMQ